MANPGASSSPAAKAPAALPKAAKPTASASSKKPSVSKSAVKNGPASKQKPPKPGNKEDSAASPKTAKTPNSKPATAKPDAVKNTAGATPPVKQAAPKPAIGQPPGDATTKKKSRARVSKAKKGASDLTATRPTLSDGKVEREIWHPSDGNGDPSPKLVEDFRSKRSGHPTWKLFTGRNIPKQPTDSNPPRYAYLDDKAAWDILHSNKWTANEKHRFWSFDFTPQGRLSFLRAHRGRPAYERDGKTFTSIKKQKDKRYWFHGCHPAPSDDASNGSVPAPGGETVVAEGGTAIAPTEQSTMQTDDGTKSQVTEKATEEEKAPVAEATTGEERVPVPEKTGVEEQVPLAGHVALPEQIPAPQQVQEPQTPPSSASIEVLRPQTPSPGPQMTHDKPRQPPQPSRTASPSPEASDKASPSPASSFRSSKRSASPSNLTSPVPKRQRKAITPYTIPPDVDARDSELFQLRKEVNTMHERDTKREMRMDELNQRAAFYHRAAMASNASLAKAEKEGEAFRKLALGLYARAVDQHQEIADHHESMLRIEKSANDLAASSGILAAEARAEMKVARKTHSSLDEMLDRSELTMREAGLQGKFDNFVQEAMALD